MKGFLERVWVWLKFNPILYYPVRVEYIRFTRTNEYLITTYTSRSLLGGLMVGKDRVERCIGCAYERSFFAERFNALRDQGVPIEFHSFSTLEEFTAFAKDHPSLRNDSWVIMRLTVINQIPHYPEPGT